MKWRCARFVMLDQSASDGEKIVRRIIHIDMNIVWIGGNGIGIVGSGIETERVRDARSKP